MKNLKNERWKVVPSNSKSEYKIIGTVPCMKFKIATVPYMPGETVSDETGEKLKDEAYAHACLIAGAPELLEALQTLLNSLNSYDENDLDAIVLAKAAIKKATINKDF